MEGTMRSPDLLTAVGIGVSDMKRSVDFYSRVIGMKVTQTFKLDHMVETILAFEGRTAVVLMHYTDGSKQHYKDNPVKLVFYFTDPKAVAARIRAAGYEITREPEPLPSFGNAIVGLAKDPDGYVVELLESPVAKAEAPKAAAVGGR
jgi:lactoylglutathione lyase